MIMATTQGLTPSYLSSEVAARNTSNGSDSNGTESGSGSSEQVEEKGNNQEDKKGRWRKTRHCSGNKTINKPLFLLFESFL